MQKIKTIVEELGITEKRNRLIKNTYEMMSTKSEMSKLSFTREVGLYVYDCDKLSFLLENPQEKDQTEITRLQEETKTLSTRSDVMIYIHLEEYLEQLKKENQEYYKSIQIDLRKELMEIELPEIYVYQGAFKDDSNFKLSRHIIVPGSVIAYYNENSETTVYPLIPIKSQRDARHFYNRTSFHYLEEVTKDYNFDLKGKNIGKTKILSR